MDRAGDVVTKVEDLLARRAAAVQDGNRTAFLADVARRDKAFVRWQEQYFQNLRELPLATFRYDVPDGGVEARGRGRVEARVYVSLQLDGFDKVPVESEARYAFRQSGNGQLRLVSVRDPAFEEKHDIDPAPWDLGPIEVESSEHVLGIFDPQSIDAAYQIIPAVEDGIADVSHEVPMKWSGTVVVYALTDLTVLSELDNLPGGDPNHLDGVAFPVRAGPGSGAVASTRFLLHPRMIYRNDATRDRLIRHELTHVALGSRDDTVPTWFSEGLAEYVSVQPIPAHERMISRDAVEAARAGLDGLPADATFNGSASAANYGISWYACEYVASTFGETALWRLFDALRKGEGTGSDDQDDVLVATLGIDSAQLARGAGEKMLGTFG
ncbi:hypothetical protein ncot_08240 [Nocardioides sp. JQ2195]|uniref:hypothetical protein n=1 Tax=Nocardioides sp. JQ2195 TaxID=2592334 RepID=UPI00143EC40F|nr:hypothetical protein [Nocardioides sp. JQ2195]QIX26593.1 hypothetical protein ncot_08240 [Nocardioides sp. JQ2195]